MDEAEIAQARWFPHDALPAEATDYTRRMVAPRVLGAVPGVTRQERLDAIADEIRDSPARAASSRASRARRSCPGEGNPDARIVLVGEAPGANEDRLGRPFVGAAGKFLDTLLAEAGLRARGVFITNVLKSRPPGNRDPRADEVAHSWPWLEAQLAVIEPELVVPLGRHALARFDPAAKIADVHGRPHACGRARPVPALPPGGGAARRQAAQRADRGRAGAGRVAQRRRLTRNVARLALPPAGVAVRR